MENFNIQHHTQILREEYEEDDLDETSTTSGVGVYQRKDTAKDTYKKNKGERTTGGMVYKDMWEYEINEVYTRVDYEKALALLKKIENTNPKLYDTLLSIVRGAAIDPYPQSYSDLEDVVANSITENYSRFKNETKTRSKQDQFHQAIREVRKKVQDIDKVYEYVNRLKNDLNEENGGLKYKKHTELAIQKIKEMVSELNMKIKKFK